jgi:hypothetical protein
LKAGALLAPKYKTITMIKQSPITEAIMEMQKYVKQACSEPNKNAAVAKLPKNFAKWGSQ